MRPTMAGIVACVLLCSCNRNVAPPRIVLAEYEGPVQSRDVMQGLHIYQSICAVCHAGRVNPEGYHWSPGQMRQQIRRGNRLMPPLGHDLLTDAQVEAVLAYLVGTYAVDGVLPAIGAEDLARERERARRHAQEQRRVRAELEYELDPELLDPTHEAGDGSTEAGERVPPTGAPTEPSSTVVPPAEAVEPDASHDTSDRPDLAPPSVREGAEELSPPR